MGIYDRQIETAKRLIKAKGQLVIWRKRNIVDTSKVFVKTNSGHSDYNVSILFLPKSGVMNEFIRLMKGSDIPAGSLTGLMAAQKDFIPAIIDIIVTPTDIYKINGLNPLAPNGDIIFYQLDLGN